MLETQSSIRTIELARKLNVTDETIRRDLEFLDEEKKLIKTHGGALRIEKRIDDLPLHARLKENRQAKNEIARKALGFVKEGDTLLLDASSTTLALAEILPDVPMTVITNAHDVVVALMPKKKITVILTGGKLDREGHSYGGLLSWVAVKRFSVDTAFFSCNGLDTIRGASEAIEWHAEFKENALPACHQKILLCDSRKFGLRGYRFFADLSSIDKVITDSEADTVFVNKLRSAGVEVM